MPGDGDGARSFDSLREAAQVVREVLMLEIDRSADPGETFDSLRLQHHVEALDIVAGVLLALEDVPPDERDHAEWVGQIALNHHRGGR